jgi:hypothetical protein
MTFVVVYERFDEHPGNRHEKILEACDEDQALTIVDELLNGIKPTAIIVDYYEL